MGITAATLANIGTPPFHAEPLMEGAHTYV